MSRIIDLSWDIVGQMPVFTGDPGVDIITYEKYYQTGYCVSQLIIGTHAGTHVDAPMHKCENGKSIDIIPIESFIGKALIADFSYLRPGDEISPGDLTRYENDIKKCSIVLLKTNWSEHYGLTDFFNRFPGISYEAACWLANQDISLVGFDSPSVSATEHVKIHEVFFSRDIMIVESLCHLKLIREKFVQFFAVPLKIKGADGSPARAFAIED